jgi:hypothetical protein
MNDQTFLLQALDIHHLGLCAAPLGNLMSSWASIFILFFNFFADVKNQSRPLAPSSHPL